MLFTPKRMTIKGLWKYIDDKHHACLKQVPQSSFARLRVAIDAMGIFFRLRMRSRTTYAARADVIAGPLPEDKIDTLWLQEITRFLLDLLRNDITPVLIFERGVNKMKEGKKKERDEERAKTQEKIDALRSTLTEQYNRSPLSIDQRKLTELRKLEGSLKSLTPESRERAYDYCRGIGLPCLMGKSGVEAEKLASILTIRGIAAATYSPDGDCLCHGCPLMIRREGPNTTVGNRAVKTFEIVFLSDVLQSTSTTQKQFTDACIMSGCDYNENIPYIGVSKSFDLVKSNGCVEYIPTNVLQKASRYKFEGLECLRLQECREEFTPPPEGPEYLTDFEYKPSNNTSALLAVKPYDEECKATLEAYGLSQYNDQLQNALADYPSSRDYVHGAETLSNVSPLPKVEKNK